jgi:hypothetical protein
VSKSSRFNGTVQRFAEVHAGVMQAWILGIPLSDWPRQNRPGEPFKPAMIADPNWHGFAEIAQPIVDSLMGHYPGCNTYQHYVSNVLPGNLIEPHKDEQGHDWLVRIHVPLTSNPLSTFIVDGQPYRMDPGSAYKVNTLLEHSVINRGETPRIHFMFDVRG